MLRSSLRKYWYPSLWLVMSTLISPLAKAVPEFYLELRDHLFYPSEITIPANKKVKLIIHNFDTTPEEFDSFELNREKVIFGNSKAYIFVGPLPPGTYHFFGEYNPNTARGAVIVVPQGDAHAD